MTKLQMDELSALEADYTTKQTDYTENLTQAASEAVKEARTTLETRRKQVQFEADLKTRTFEKYKATTSAGDFERLWSTRLRDDEMIAAAKKRESAVTEAAKHKIYSKF